jgi:signal transduction histidine kinase
VLTALSRAAGEPSPDSTSDGSTGLGLGIARQVAGGHGWDVAIRDSPSGDERFEITGDERVEISGDERIDG